MPPRLFARRVENASITNTAKFEVLVNCSRIRSPTLFYFLSNRYAKLYSEQRLCVFRLCIPTISKKELDDYVLCTNLQKILTLYSASSILSHFLGIQTSLIRLFSSEQQPRPSLELYLLERQIQILLLARYLYTQRCNSFCRNRYSSQVDTCR